MYLPERTDLMLDLTSSMVSRPGAPLIKKTYNYLKLCRNGLYAWSRVSRPRTMSENSENLALQRLKPEEEEEIVWLLTEFFHGYDNLNPLDYFTLTEQVMQRESRSSAAKHLRAPTFRKSIGKHSFKKRIVSLWNNLPLHVRESTSINSFKANYDKFV